jgi:hypothetical protein
MNKTILLKKLQLYNYLAIVVVGLVALKGFFLAKYWFTIDAKSSLGIGLGTFSMICLLITVPFILKFFSTKTKQLHLLSNEEEKTAGYIRWSLVRLGVITFNLSLNILFYYLLQTNSFLFAAGIAAVALYFCKPSESKINADLFEKKTDDTIDNQDKE